VREFRPLLGFDELDRVYRRSDLFPLFDGRVMSARRPDYDDYMRVLDPPTDSGPWEQLTRSQGTQVTDTLQLFPVPHLVGNAWHCRFLVHGVRHVAEASTREARNPAVERHLARLSPGDPLVLRDDPATPVNPSAVLTCDGGEHPLGPVPDFLVAHVRALRGVGQPDLRVAAVNGPSTPGHLRLAVHLRGRAPSGYTLFSSEGYQPLA
jgi:hypothetical protein